VVVMHLRLLHALHDEERDTVRLACAPRGSWRDSAGQRTESTSHRRAELNARFPDILCVTGLSWTLSAVCTRKTVCGRRAT
jgi:hypothetical protein